MIKRRPGAQKAPREQVIEMLQNSDLKLLEISEYFNVGKSTIGLIYKQALKEGINIPIRKKGRSQATTEEFIRSMEEKIQESDY